MYPSLNLYNLEAVQLLSILTEYILISSQMRNEQHRLKTSHNTILIDSGKQLYMLLLYGEL